MRHPAIALAAICLAGGALSTPVWAQEPETVDSIWLRFDLPGGCFAYESKLFDMVENAPKATATWSGACKAGEAISGPGVLALRRNRVNGYDTLRTYKASFTAGYLNGPVTISDTYQSMTNKADKGAEPVHTFPYRMGCMLLQETREPESGSVGKQYIKCRPKTAGEVPSPLK